METKRMYSKIEEIEVFSDWLSRKLEYREMTVTRLAKLSGVHPNTIHNYLAGRCEPTLFNAQCILNALGYKLGALDK